MSKNKPQTGTAPAPQVKFAFSPLFLSTYEDAKKKSNKLEASFDAFRKFKEQTPLDLYGSRDAMFIGGGNLKSAVPNENLRHVHLLHDMILVYSLTGDETKLFKLYGVFTHDQLGIGQPPNMKRQKQAATAFAGAFRPK